MSGKVIDVEGVSLLVGANIHQWSWYGGDGQKWQSKNTDSTINTSELTPYLMFGRISLSPGKVGNNQNICENTDPLPFTSEDIAIGNGTITYQWQYSFDPNNESSWVDLANENAETFDAPILKDLVPSPFTVFARRVATDLYSSTSSNIVSISVKGLYPGEVGNNQIIFESDDPAPFTNIESAHGSDDILYQWQYTLDQNDPNSWVDLAGETSEVFDAPVLKDIVPAPFTAYARRKAINDCGNVYSNVVFINVNLDTTFGKTLSDDNINTTSFIIYPNPVSTTLTVKIKSIGTLQIYNSNGILLITKKIDADTTINIASFAPGIYIAKLIDENSVSIKQFIKK